MRMIVNIILRASLAVGLLLGAAEARAATGVLHDTDSVLRDFFPQADSVERTTLAITPELGARLKSRLGYVPCAPSYTVFVGHKDGRNLGYAVIDNEKGMHEPITFAVLVSPDGSVSRQEVMVYRESEGDGVTSNRFQNQFVGKTVRDPLKTGVDIQIVSSATISSNSMAVGVKRVLALVTEGILSQPGAPAGSGAGSDTGSGTADVSAAHGFGLTAGAR